MIYDVTQQTYAVILVGGDGGENCLAKDKSFVRLRVERADWRVSQRRALLAAPQHQVNTRLILVHRVEDNLRAWAWVRGCGRYG